MTPVPARVPVFVLAGITATAPLAIDAYLPAMPSMAQDLDTSIHDIELSLSLFLAGFALGQLIGGPLSDQWGRRSTLFLGLGIFMAGSMGIVFSPGINWIWALRVLQALGAGLAIVNPAAIIRDLSSGISSARNLGHMAMIMMTAPLLAPLLGTLLLQVSGWRSIFLCLALYALIIGGVIYYRIPETRRQSGVKQSALNRYMSVLTHPGAMGFGLSQSFSFAGMFAFITASPLVYIDYFAIGEAAYPFLFAANVVCLMIFNRLNIVLLRRFSRPPGYSLQDRAYSWPACWGSAPMRWASTTTSCFL